MYGRDNGYIQAHTSSVAEEARLRQLLFLSKAVRAYRNTCFCKQARGLSDNIVKSIMYINVRYKLFLTKDNFTSNAS